MGWVARIVACGTASCVFACATIAGLDDPEAYDLSATDGRDSSVQNASSSGAGSSSGGSSGTSSSSSGSSGVDGSGPTDANGSDAPVDSAPSCTLAQNGDLCTQHSQCCSKKCNEERKCVNDCTPGGQFGCDPTSTDSCCIGFWCNVGTCAACISSGQEAAQPAGFPLASSCCSRSLKPLSSQCQ